MEAEMEEPDYSGKANAGNLDCPRCKTETLHVLTNSPETGLNGQCVMCNTVHAIKGAD
jgi:hypothetical protein